MKGTDNTSFAHVLEQTQSEECVLVIFGGGTGSTSPSKAQHPSVVAVGTYRAVPETHRLFLRVRPRGLASEVSILISSFILRPPIYYAMTVSFR